VSPRHTLRRVWAMRHAYAFIAPFYLLFLVFGAFPLVWSFLLTFREWDGLRPMKAVGLRNFAMLLRDQRFMDALGNTVAYWLVDVLFILVLALLMASALNVRGLGGKRGYRLILFLPNVTATVAVSLVFTMVFDFNSGLANGILYTLGLRPLGWLNSTQLSKVPVMVLSVWRATPWYMLIILSGLQAISPELYQAATVDGAGPVQKLFHVTIPGLAPILFFCFLTETIDSFRIFTEPYVMTGGGPGASSLSVVQYLYESAFTIFKLGYASAIAYVLTLILIVISAAQVILLRRQGAVPGGAA
jgi:ABC-type sugar transport system permease subunit